MVLKHLNVVSGHRLEEHPFPLSLSHSPISTSLLPQRLTVNPQHVDSPFTQRSSGFAHPFLPKDFALYSLSYCASCFVFVFLSLPSNNSLLQGFSLMSGVSSIKLSRSWGEFLGAFSSSRMGVSSLPTTLDTCPLFNWHLAFSGMRMSLNPGNVYMLLKFLFQL